MISFIFSASTSRENLKIQKLALDVFQLSSASTLVFLVVRDAPASRDSHREPVFQRSHSTSRLTKEYCFGQRYEVHRAFLEDLMEEAGK
jgi:hypothetical protein